MVISLSKGEKISLSDMTANLQHIQIGVGWDPVLPEGLLGRLTGPKDVDLDVSVLLFNHNKERIGMVYFGNLKSSDGAIVHLGDNISGDGRGDDEVITIDLERLDAGVDTLLFCVNSYQGHTFDEVDNAFWRVVDADTGNELCRFTLNDTGPHTAVLMATLSRHNGHWQIHALGVSSVGRTADQLVPDAMRHI
ncbi:MAG: TerD family protein [Pseudomonadota bacterium]